MLNSLRRGVFVAYIFAALYVMHLVWPQAECGLINAAYSTAEIMTGR